MMSFVFSTRILSLLCDNVRHTAWCFAHFEDDDATVAPTSIVINQDKYFQTKTSSEGDE